MAYTTNPDAPAARALAVRMVLRNGLSRAEAARRCGVYRSTVGRWLERASELDRPSPEADDEWENLRQRVIAKRMTRSAAGAMLGVSRETVRRWLIQGRPTRPRTETKFDPAIVKLAVGLVRDEGVSPYSVAWAVDAQPATVYLWLERDARPRPRLTVPQGIPTRSSRPIRPRTTVDPAVEARIIELREQTGRCAPVLSAMLARQSVVISESSIARILKRHSLTRPRRPRPYAVERPRPRVRFPGDLVEIDLVHVFGRPQTHPGYIATVVDVASRWAYAAYVSRARPADAARVIVAAQAAAPFGFKTVQSDRGFEFGAAFVDVVHAHGMRFRHIRPHRPNDNAHVERFNRTLQQEYFRRIVPAPNPATISETLPRFLADYNSTRPHMGLGYATPVEAIVRLTTIRPSHGKRPQPASS